MTKKIISLAALTLALTAAPITPSFAQDDDPFGAYAGAGIGIQQRNFKFFDENGNVLTNNNLERLSGHFILGYDMALTDQNNWFIGAETSTDIGNSESQINLSGRFGYRIPNNIKLYAKTGYTSRFSGLGKDGWHVGAGAEYPIGNKWRLRTEYQYADFNKTTNAFTTISFEQKTQQVVAAVLFDF